MISTDTLNDLKTFLAKVHPSQRELDKLRPIREIRVIDKKTFKPYYIKNEL